MATARKRNGKYEMDMQGRLNSLRGDLDMLQQDVRRFLADVGDAASGGMQSAMSGAIHSAQGAYDEFEDWGGRSLRDVRKSVRAQPLRACLFAMGAGAFLGAFLLRR